VSPTGGSVEALGVAVAGADDWRLGAASDAALDGGDAFAAGVPSGGAGRLAGRGEFEPLFPRAAGPVTAGPVTAG
jgi:hypothetical protein